MAAVEFNVNSKKWERLDTHTPAFPGPCSKGDGWVVISRINNNGAGVTDIKFLHWDRDYKGTTITSFQLNGQPYIFGLKTDTDKAAITRINPDLTIEHFDFYWLLDYDYQAVESFELNDEPYLFALRDCCRQLTVPVYEKCFGRPDELYIKRIYEDADGIIHIEGIYQMEDMRIIRDTTVRDDMPAIMMGDFNVHKTKFGGYGIMNEIFAKAGAKDAWITGNGSGEGETINRCDNKLDQHFHSGRQKPDCCPNCSEDWQGRIDYVYYKENSSPNSPPKVDAGPDQTTDEGTSVSLASTFKDEESEFRLVPTKVQRTHLNSRWLQPQQTL